MALLTSITLIAACGKREEPLIIPLDAGMDAATTDVTNASDVGLDGGGLPETPRPDIEIVLLDQEITFEGGESGRVGFDIPDGAVSVTVSVNGDEDHLYGLSEWLNGDGSALVHRGWLDSDPGAPSLCFGCVNRVATSQSAFAAIAPINESVVVAPGAHNIAVFGREMLNIINSRPIADGRTAMVRVVAKVLPAAPQTGVLDINFYLTGAQGWTAATAPTDSALQGIIGELGELYSQVGIELGVLTYTDIPAEFNVVESVLFDTDIEELFALSADQPRHAINVFLVEELFLGAGPGFGVLLGISGGIPGPPMGGTRRSGVAINTKGDPQVNALISGVIGHEIGHHLGLFHTTEQAGQGVHDPIADTPEDDSTLLMFASGNGTIITATQGQVMRSNSYVHHGGE